MFALNPALTYVNYFDAVQQYEQQRQAQYERFLEEQQRVREQQAPKIIKKVETENSYQVQIFKKSGNFNTYEVKAIRPRMMGGNFVNLVIQSQHDNFRKVFQFNLDDIELDQIDWEYYSADNVLVLNVPKKIKVCHDAEDLAALFGFPFHLMHPNGFSRGSDQLERCPVQKQSRKEESTLDAEVKNRKVAAEKAKRFAKVRAEKLKEVEAKREKELQAKREREAEYMRKREAEYKRQELMRKQEAEARQKELEARHRQAEARQRAAEADRAKQNKERELYQKKYQEEMAQKQQEFLKQVFGQVFGVPSTQKAPEESSSKQPEHTFKSSAAPSFADPEVESPANSKDTDFHDHSDDESISSESSTPSLASPVKSESKLHRSPSLEEVEDEEFVMFRKKFGH